LVVDSGFVGSSLSVKLENKMGESSIFLEFQRWEDATLANYEIY